MRLDSYYRTCYGEYNKMPLWHYAPMTARNGALRGVPADRGVPKTACRFRPGESVPPLKIAAKGQKQRYAKVT